MTTSVPQVQITARDYYVLTKGIPLGAAIALVSVLYHESHLSPGSQGYQTTETPGVLNPHGAYGIASWNGPRQQDLLTFATNHNLPVSALDTQLAFVLTEIANSYPNVWAAIRSTASYQSIINILTDEYEIPANKAAEINDSLAIAGPLASLPAPVAAPAAPPTPTPAAPQVVVGPTVPSVQTPPPAAPTVTTSILPTVAGMDAAILDHFGAILDALTQQRDAINVRIAKLQAQATEFAQLEGAVLALPSIPQIPEPANPAAPTTQGNTVMLPTILKTIATNWATSALGTVAGGPSVIDVIQNPANWQHDLPGIATVILGLIAKDGWVTGGTTAATPEAKTRVGS